MSAPRYTDYCVIEATTVAFFTKNVNCAIKEGWQPIGGVSVTCVYEKMCLCRYSQAMGKPEGEAL